MNSIRFSRTLSLTLFALAATSAAGEDWPQFRGPSGDGCAVAKNLPERWGGFDGPAWQTSVNVGSKGRVTVYVPLDEELVLRLAVDAPRSDQVDLAMTVDGEITGSTGGRTGTAPVHASSASTRAASAASSAYVWVTDRSLVGLHDSPDIR